MKQIRHAVWVISNTKNNNKQYDILGGFLFYNIEVIMIVVFYVINTHVLISSHRHHHSRELHAHN